MKRPIIFPTDKSLSSGYEIRETNCLIQWIGINPVDSVIHPLNNWGQDLEYNTETTRQQLKVINMEMIRSWQRDFSGSFNKDGEIVYIFRHINGSG